MMKGGWRQETHRVWLLAYKWQCTGTARSPLAKVITVINKGASMARRSRKVD